MEIVLALVAALLFALGTVLQQKAGLDEPTEGDASGLLIQMAKRPVWLAGIAADALGFVAQAIALTIGRLAVVQPLLVASVVFALPLGARLTGQKVRALDVGAAVVVTIALAVFLIVADPTGGRDDAPFGDWVVALGICFAASALLVLAARPMGAGKKAALLGAAAGIGFGVSAALTKTVGDQFTDAPLEIFVHWHVYALCAVGYASLTISQLSLQTGKLAPAIATAMAFDPLASVVLGVTLLEESLHTSTAGSIAACAALAAAIGGLAVLARREEGSTQTKPAGGHQVAKARRKQLVTAAPAPQPAPAAPANAGPSP
jgi:drug/metabolite transporter (DMT)-like permease